MNQARERDGVVNALDATLILQYVAGLISCRPRLQPQALPVDDPQGPLSGGPGAPA